MTAQVLVLILSKLTSSVEIKLPEEKKCIQLSALLRMSLRGERNKEVAAWSVSSVLGLLLGQNLFRFSDLRKRNLE